MPCGIGPHVLEFRIGPEANQKNRSTAQKSISASTISPPPTCHQCRPDPSGLFEPYDPTLWFIALWFPIFPIASYTVRRDLERWLGMTAASDAVAIERHPRNWEQILLTWVKAASLFLALRLAFLLMLPHPEWLRHIR